MGMETNNLSFVEKMNPTTGKLEWVAQNDDERDYFTDIARSSYADMLHDTERNKLYYKAIKKAVKEIHRRGQRAKVLDIGTGSGLLSMMAAVSGADSITAIEVFTPMAEVAKRVTKFNGFEKIKVINKHSLEVELGVDLMEKANILITELFDTELIGEGALCAYEHAHTTFMEEDCIAVPYKATTYVQIVESKVMRSWHELQPISIQTKNDLINILPPPKMLEGVGVPAVHDIQLSQIPEGLFKEICSPVKVFEFEWGSRKLSSNSRCSLNSAVVKNSGKAEIVLSWWDLEMDFDGETILSTAPSWLHPEPSNMQWRDHWMQSVYFPPSVVLCGVGDCVTVKAFHDSYSMWFEISKGEIPEEISPKQIVRPLCDYPPRMKWSRRRLGMVNDEAKNRKYAGVLDGVDGNTKQGLSICVSDFGLLPILASATGFKRIAVLEHSNVGATGLKDILQHNKLTNVDVIDMEKFDIEKHKNTVDFLFAEPFFATSILPWHDIYFWYVRTRLNSCLRKGAKIMPLRAHLFIAAVNFSDLHKIRAPVGTVEGFDLSIMDDMIENALETKEYGEAEPHSLWEYPNTLLSDPKHVLTFDFTKCVPDHEITTTDFLRVEKFGNAKQCHGIVLWMDYDLDSETTITTGLKCVNEERSTVWDMHSTQGVFFFRKPIDVSRKVDIEYNFDFVPSNGDLKMKFDVE